MNERIRELAEQATEIIDVSAKLGMPGTDRIFNKEKFAELIVRECAKISEKSQWTEAKGEYYQGFNEAMIYVSSKIKQHFGVEQ